jgi:hypothetical protein
MEFNFQNYQVTFGLWLEPNSMWTRFQLFCVFGGLFPRCGFGISFFLITKCIHPQTSRCDFVSFQNVGHQFNIGQQNNILFLWFNRRHYLLNFHINLIQTSIKYLHSQILINMTLNIFLYNVNINNKTCTCLRLIHTS